MKNKVEGLHMASEQTGSHLSLLFFTCFRQATYAYVSSSFCVKLVADFAWESHQVKSDHYWSWVHHFKIQPIREKKENLTKIKSQEIQQKLYSSKCKGLKDVSKESHWKIMLTDKM